MEYLELRKDDARKLFDNLSQNGIPEDYYDKLPLDYRKIRENVLQLIDFDIEKSYDFDLKFALIIHEYFKEKNLKDFNEAIASNYDFWRYICLKVFPDIIFKRHGWVKEYFYDKNVRLYVPTMWWYIEFGYQGNNEQTYKALKNLSTDYILQIVERPGREGLYLDIMRTILKYFIELSKEVINYRVGNQSLLRRIMILNTAKIDNFNLVIEDDTDSYVKELFKECGVDL